ncbi:MAG: glucose-1-phosphate cytidylyltransferase, partial [bacterium]
AIQPPGRFGVFNLDEGQTIIPNFREKQWEGQAWINGGFFVLESKVIDYIENDDSVWEQEPMVQLSRQGQLAAYRHEGYWQNMDTLRDKRVLEELWHSDSPPWKIW